MLYTKDSQNTFGKNFPSLLKKLIKRYYIQLVTFSYELNVSLVLVLVYPRKITMNYFFSGLEIILKSTNLEQIKHSTRKKKLNNTEAQAQ